jgi:uncharacterized membrane protein
MRTSPPRTEPSDRIASQVARFALFTAAGVLVAGLGLWTLSIEPLASRVLDAAVLMLVATPAARMVTSLAESARERDWFLVTTTATVLLVLLAGVVSAFLAG